METLQHVGVDQLHTCLSILPHCCSRLRDQLWTRQRLATGNSDEDGMMAVNASKTETRVVNDSPRLEREGIPLLSMYATLFRVVPLYC